VCALITTTSTSLRVRATAPSAYTMCSLANAVTPSTIRCQSLCLLQQSGKKSNQSNTFFRWRPLNAPGVTKNVIIATNADGGLYHWHTTSGKRLNRIHDEYNQLLTCDYKPDGLEFLTGGSDNYVRLYDEQTRQEKLCLINGANGEPGHSLRVFCAKFSKENENVIISGGWDKNVKMWDTRTGAIERNICGPFICGDSIDIHDGYILTGSYQDSS